MMRNLTTMAMCAVLALPAMAWGADGEAGRQTVAESGDRSAYMLDGMVGQVNGRPIYANRVLRPMEEQLSAMGRQMSQDEFRERAGELIGRQLQGLVENALLLGEAERDLSERERQGLQYMVRSYRKELVRQYGRGSAAVAEARLQEQRGMTLDQALEEFRQERIIGRYLSQRLFPQINVTNRDIQRYYRDNYEEFNPPAERKIRLIRTAEAEDAELVAERLGEGRPFEELATDATLNAFRSREGGLMEAPGDAPLAHEALNDALAELEVGEHVGPIEAGDRYWFIELVETGEAEDRSFQEAQLEIEERLRERQYHLLDAQYRERLYEEGSYNPLGQMVDDLVEIAVNRYAADS